MRRAALLAAALGVAGLPSGVLADPPRDLPNDPHQQARLVRGAASDLGLAGRVADSLREAGARSSVEGVVHGSFLASGWDLRVPPAPDGADLPVPGADLALRDALGDLHASVLSAQSAVVEIVGRPSQDVLRRLIAARPGDRAALRRLRAAAGIDVRAIAGYGVAIAAGIDRLLAVAPHVDPPVVGAAAECDVLDARPTLCVGGTGANTYTTDFGLLVDLGGGDTYRNGSGAGACLAGSVFAPRCVSVVVDLGGDDAHQTPAGACGSTASTCGQGAGVLGLGMLVDAGGNDTYVSMGTAAVPSGGCLGDSASCGSVAAHGSGGLGVGVLADLGGNDSYVAAFDRSVRGPDGFEATQAVVAHGAGVLGGGILWDAAGNDTYEARVHSTGRLGRPSEDLLGQEWQILGGSGVVGQGAALAGPAALLDGGGTDSFVARAAPAPQSGDPVPGAPRGQGGAAYLAVQGFAEAFAHEGWVGPLVTGNGNTSYTAEVLGRLTAFIIGQGAARFGAAHGMVDDAGGNDRYTMSTASEVRFLDRCACEQAAVTLDLLADPFTSHFGFARPQAYGQGAQQGSLRDRGGDDEYVARARSDLEVVAENLRPGGAARAGVVLVGEIAGSPGAWPGLTAQGAPGPLRDDGGNDRYTIDAARSVHARASAVPGEPGEPADELAWAFPGLLAVTGQGIGLGTQSHLEDRGGRDSYVARYAADGRATPDVPGRSSDGVNFVGVQGGDGLLTDTDTGDPDLFHADSALTLDTCVGRYGEAPGWVSGPTLRDGTCSPTWGAAVAATTVPPGRDSRVSILSAEPAGHEDYPAWEVEVRVTDATGAAVPGARLSVALEHGYSDPDPLVDQLFPWVDVTRSSTELSTGPDGIARGIVPAQELACRRGCTGLTGAVRVRAVMFPLPGAHRPAQGVRIVRQAA